ncbi:MAG: fumarylacetoacetate hydrolase family protein, partial [Acidimicrobiales bacterium]
MADWPPSPAGGFGLGALPYGVDQAGHVVVALGDSVIDLAQLSGLDVGGEVWTAGSLAELWALGSPAWARTRQQLRELLGPSSRPQPRARRPRHEVQMGLAWDVADYVDFYASEAHASAMGRLMRPGTDPLPPAWRHLPIGYHGRASGVVASGSAVPRPRGLVEGEAGPILAATDRLDVEVELGFVIGTGSPRGGRIDVARAAEHIF